MTDDGSAVVEFVLVGVLLVATLLGVLQVAVYLHVRNVVVASAAEGARYGASADVPATAGGPRAQLIAAGALGTGYASTLSCVGSQVVDGVSGLTLVEVDCRAPGPLVLGWLGHVQDLDVRARSIEEGP